MSEINSIRQTLKNLRNEGVETDQVNLGITIETAEELMAVYDLANDPLASLKWLAAEANTRQNAIVENEKRIHDLVRQTGALKEDNKILIQDRNTCQSMLQMMRLERKLNAS